MGNEKRKGENDQLLFSIKTARGKSKIRKKKNKEREEKKKIERK